MISIIIATYNSGKTLEQCLKSIFNQTSNNYEILIIDGNSTDNTISIIEKYINKIAYFISESDCGIYDAWNKGIGNSKGEWLMFLGSDDYLTSIDVLNNLLSNIDSFLLKTTRILYSKVQIIDYENNILGILGEDWTKVKSKMKVTMSIPHPGCLHHISLFKEIGLFNSSYRIAGDYEYLLRVFKKFEAGFIENVTSVNMRIGGISSDKKNYLKLVKEEFMARIKNNIQPFNKTMFKRLFYGFYLKLK